MFLQWKGMQMRARGKGKRERGFRCRPKVKMDWWWNRERERNRVHIVPGVTNTHLLSLSLTFFFLFFTLPFLFMATSHSQQGDYLFLWVDLLFSVGIWGNSKQNDRMSTLPNTHTRTHAHSPRNTQTQTSSNQQTVGIFQTRKHARLSYRGPALPYPSQKFARRRVRVWHIL